MSVGRDGVAVAAVAVAVAAGVVAAVAVVSQGTAVTAVVVSGMAVAVSMVTVRVASGIGSSGVSTVVRVRVAGRGDSHQGRKNQQLQRKERVSSQLHLQQFRF